MKQRRRWEAAAAAAVMIFSAAPVSYAAESKEGMESQFWVQLKETNVGDWDFLKSAGIVLSAEEEEPEGKMTMEFWHDGRKLLSGNAYFDGEKNLQFTAPELTDTVFNLDLEELVMKHAGEIEELGGDITVEQFLEKIEENSEALQDIENFKAEDFEAMIERYQETAEEELEKAMENAEIETAENVSCTIYGEEVVFPKGTSVKIPKESMVDVTEMSVDFWLDDAYCRELLQMVIDMNYDSSYEGERFDLEENAEELKSELHEELEKTTSAFYMNFYQTEEDEIAHIFAWMEPENEEGLDFEFLLSDYEGIAELGFKLYEGEDVVGFQFTKADSQENGAEKREITLNLTAVEDTIDFLYKTVYDREKGDYKLDFTMSGGGMEIAALSSNGNLKTGEEGIDLTFDDVTLSSGGLYFSLTGGFKSQALEEPIKPVGNPAMALDVLTASDERMEAELNRMMGKFDMILMQIIPMEEAEETEALQAD